MRYDKPDANKPAIVRDLQERGFIWLDIGGAVDGLCIGYHRELCQVAACLVEIKNPDGRGMRFTKSERTLQSQLVERDFHGIYLVATKTEDVLAWFGAI